MSPIERRLQKAEGAVDAGVIAPDQRDPKLIPVFQLLCGENFRIEEVPCGVSCSDFVGWILAETRGTGFKPVRLPAG